MSMVAAVSMLSPSDGAAGHLSLFGPTGSSLRLPDLVLEEVAVIMTTPHLEKRQEIRIVFLAAVSLFSGRSQLRSRTVSVVWWLTI